MKLLFCLLHFISPFFKIMFYFSLLIYTFGQLLYNIVILLSNSGSVCVPTPTFTGQETWYILNRLQVKKKERKNKRKNKQNFISFRVLCLIFFVDLIA